MTFRKPHHRPVTMGVFTFFCLVATVAWADGASKAPDWVLTPDGSHIVQRSTRLLWPRCVEGMRWNGKDCIGEPLGMAIAEATALARSRTKADGHAWRLPHLKELQQLAHLAGQTSDMGRTALPESTQGWCWSGTAAIDTRQVNAYRYDNIMKGLNGQNVNQMKFLHGWAVNTATGESRNDVLKRTLLYVRLVRPAD